jgi:sugar/nucleoside kinase (ribokinase family)
MSGPHLLVAGHIMMDVMVRPEATTESTSDTPSQVSISRGGAGANIARSAHASGVSATFVGALGNDLIGQLIASQFDFPAEFQRSTKPTGALVALVHHDGQRAMLTQAGANEDLSSDFLASALDTYQPDWFHLSGYIILSSATRAAGQAAIAHAHSRGIPVSTDACSVGPLIELGPKNFLDAITGVTLLCCNAEEHAVLSPYLADSSVELLTTLGSDGARFSSREGTWEAPSVATKVVDTTGAGDAATGAFLASRLLHGDPDIAVRAAMDRAAEVIGRLGAN